jgi:fused signal recognition particle receptor
VLRNLFRGVADLFAGAREVTDELFDELEEALIASDVSARVATDAVDLVRAAVRDQKIREVDRAKDVLRAHIAGILDEHSRPLVVDGVQPPLFYLTVGVNGTGKTTTIAKLASRFQRRGERVLPSATAARQRSRGGGVRRHPRSASTGGRRGDRRHGGTATHQA